MRTFSRITVSAAQSRGRRYYRNRSGIAILKSLVSVSVSILGNFQYQYQNRNRHSLKSGTPLNDFGHFIKIYVIKLVWLWYQYRNRNRNSHFSWYQYQYRNRPDAGQVSVSELVSKKLVSPAPAVHPVFLGLISKEAAFSSQCLASRVIIIWIDYTYTWCTHT